MSNKTVYGFSKRQIAKKIIDVSIQDKLNPTFLAEWEKWHDEARADELTDSGPLTGGEAATPGQDEAMRKLVEHLEPKKAGYTEQQAVTMTRTVLLLVINHFHECARASGNTAEMYESFGLTLKQLLKESESSEWLKSLLTT